VGGLREISRKAQQFILSSQGSWNKGVIVVAQEGHKSPRGPKSESGIWSLVVDVE